jgi:hypothetical protein
VRFPRATRQVVISIAGEPHWLAKKKPAGSGMLWRSASGPADWFSILRRRSSSIARIRTGVATFRSSRLILAAGVDGEALADALDRWDGEGGAPAIPWPLPYETGKLLDAERRVLECLGASLVSEWNDLPTDVQRRLFEHAASGKSHDAALLKARIARFLHNHKDDWAAR